MFMHSHRACPRAFHGTGNVLACTRTDLRMYEVNGHYGPWDD